MAMTILGTYITVCRIKTLLDLELFFESNFGTYYLHINMVTRKKNVLKYLLYSQPGKTIFVLNTFIRQW